MKSNITLSIWEREFEVYVSFQNFPGEEITELQQKTKGMIFSADIDSALVHVKKYIEKNNDSGITADAVTNIFRYVIPKSIIIPRMEDGTRVFAILCKYKFDMEHGIAVVFENEKYKAIGPQDIIL